ncbi:MAG TPA: phosphate ABC transporter substrate-binding protein PstS [Gaiellaceae bacterium]|jgi:phosphate transport system substrate-binding protein|nr:phosphate ABC transporter substrate-binding protein PstS [Gaiellaceae bacterium]
MTRGLALIAAAAVALTAIAAAGAKSNDTTISGAGSSFVAPLVSTWTPAVGSAFGYTLTYSPVGSGAGIAAITNRQVDFGASDAPLSPDQAAACKSCVQIPWALSATSIAYNIPGAPVHLNLDGKTISKIFLGQITNWNDPAIKALNKGASLPDLKITPVFRSDGSGTSYNFTDYLSAVNAEWKSKIGVSTQPAFPAGVGAKGSGGVAGVVSRTSGAVTYVDVAYALKNHIRFAAVRNAAGKFLYPSLRRITAAADAFPKVPANNEMHIVNPPKSAALAYPIATFTYVIVPQQTSHAAELRKLIFWALTQGQKPQYEAKLMFAPLTKPVLVAAEKTLKTIHT